MDKLLKQPKTNKAFTLIEILISVIILGILSSAGIISYNNYLETSRERVTEENYSKIIDTMNTELLRCKLNNSERIFDSHSCESSSSPSINFLSNYFSNNLNMKNPYDKNSSIIGADVCKKGTIAITSSSTGTYDASYASSKKKKKYSKQITSSWSSNYTKTNTTNISYNCSSSGSSSQGGNIKSYKPPHNGSGAGIIVDKNGNMVKGQGAHACNADCFNGSMPNWYTFDAGGNKIYPGRPGSEYRWVMTEGASASGNIASSCSGGNCKYNFSNNTYTVLNSGTTYKAGVSIANRKPVGP